MYNYYLIYKYYLIIFTKDFDVLSGTEVKELGTEPRTSWLKLVCFLPVQWKATANDCDLRKLPVCFIEVSFFSCSEVWIK